MPHMLTKIEECLRALSKNPEPVIRWKFVRQLAPKPEPASLPDRNELAASPILKQLLCDRNSEGQIPYPPYNKWFGAHWVLSILADLEYPPGDQSMYPLQEQCYQVWLSTEHEKHIQVIDGRVRRCASQEGNCIYYSLALGLADERTEELVARLIRWQWEDGGWNCDKKPEASKSSFHETLIPLRGLSLYAKSTGDPQASRAVVRAAEVFLKRHLFKRQADGKLMDKNFARLHYPCYWHYDILFGLKVLAEAGFIEDPRCAEALDWLESKQLNDGGFPAEDRYYRVDEKKLSGHSRVDWGGTSIRRMNSFITLDALWVLKKAGRLAV
jgi:hypothetical protein